METAIALKENQLKNRNDRSIDFFLIVVILIVLLLTAIFGFLLISRPRSTAVSPDISLLQPIDNPVQSSVGGKTADPIVWEENGIIWTMRPQASYQISARVLGNKRYSDWQSSIIPRDLALGWGDMSDPAVDEWIRWRQSSRWYHYNWNGDSPYNGRYLANHSANIHIVPATDNLDKALREVQKNDLIYLEGYLVDIEARSDKQIRRVSTSLTRGDSGDGACEILYVERLVWDGRLYE